VDVNVPINLCDENEFADVQGLLSGSPSGDISWVWEVESGNGSISTVGDIDMATVTGPGIYSVTAIDNVTGCETNREFEVVLSELDLPDFSLSAEELNCTDLSTTIDIFGLDPDEVSLILVSDGTSIGQIPDNTFSYDVTSPGVYNITVINSISFLD